MSLVKFVLKYGWLIGLAVFALSVMVQVSNLVNA